MWCYSAKEQLRTRSTETKAQVSKPESISNWCKWTDFSEATISLEARLVNARNNGFSGKDLRKTEPATPITGDCCFPHTCALEAHCNATTSFLPHFPTRLETVLLWDVWQLLFLLLPRDCCWITSFSFFPARCSKIPNIDKILWPLWEEIKFSLRKQSVSVCSTYCRD